MVEFSQLARPLQPEIWSVFVRESPEAAAHPALLLTLWELQPAGSWCDAQGTFWGRRRLMKRRRGDGPWTPTVGSHIGKVQVLPPP